MDDVRDLRDGLDSALSAITPGPAPVDEAIWRGKRTRWRRRTLVAVSAAAVVAAGVLVPLAMRPLAAPSRVPSSDSGYTVTVSAPGPGAPPGLVASGTVNGQGWRVSAQMQAGLPQPVLAGPAFHSASAADVVGEQDPDGLNISDPITFELGSAGLTQVQYGIVNHTVDYATVRLSNGTVLTLHPVEMYGARIVAFAAPVGDVISDVTAYSNSGAIATWIPLNRPGYPAFLGSWQRPGQKPPAAAGGVIASGRVDGQAWSAAAYLGPWGSCVALDEELDCNPIGIPLHPGSMILWRYGPPGMCVAAAGPGVSRMVLALPGGRTMQTGTVSVGGQRFFAFSGLPAMTNLHWTAYDAAGRVVASGTS